MKNELQRLVIYVFAFLFLAACQAPHGDQAVVLQGAPEGPVVGTINGEDITMPLLEVFAEGRGLDPDDPAQRRQALDQLVEAVVLAQDAYASGLMESPQVQAEAVLARLVQLSGRRVAAYREDVRIGEAQLHAYYQQEVARAGGQEFHLQHILFDDEDAALAAAGKALQPEADFDALMAEYAAKGVVQSRDLGWANLGQLPPEIGAAAARLGDGQTLPVPVRSSFGWHVLRRVQARPFTPPPFEQVRSGAERQLVERAIAEKVTALREQAEVALPGAAQD